MARLAAAPGLSNMQQVGNALHGEIADEAKYLARDRAVS